MKVVLLVNLLATTATASMASDFANGINNNNNHHDAKTQANTGLRGHNRRLPKEKHGGYTDYKSDHKKEHKGKGGTQHEGYTSYTSPHDEAIAAKNDNYDDHKQQGKHSKEHDEKKHQKQIQKEQKQKEDRNAAKGKGGSGNPKDVYNNKSYVAPPPEPTPSPTVAATTESPAEGAAAAVIITTPSPTDAPTLYPTLVPTVEDWWVTDPPTDGANVEEVQPVDPTVYSSTTSTNAAIASIEEGFLPACRPHYDPTSVYVGGDEVEMNGYNFMCLAPYEAYCNIEVMDPNWDEVEKMYWDISWDRLGPCDMRAEAESEMIAGIVLDEFVTMPTDVDTTTDATTTEAPDTTTDAATTDAATTDAPTTDAPTTDAPTTTDATTTTTTITTTTTTSTTTEELLTTRATTEAVTTSEAATTAAATTEQAVASTTEAAEEDDLEDEPSPTGSPTYFPTTFMPTATPFMPIVTPLPDCPPPYDRAKTDYAPGEFAEVRETIFQCRPDVYTADGEQVVQVSYAKYCNIPDWNDELEEEDENAKKLWNNAWTHVGDCEPVSAMEVMEEEIEEEEEGYAE